MASPTGVICLRPSASRVDSHLGDLHRAAHGRVVADEPLHRDLVMSCTALGVRRRRAQHQRPRRPRRAGLVAVLRRLRVVVELRDGRGALAVRGAKAVRAGVAAADDDDVLALRRQRRRAVALALLVGRHEMFHREVHTVEVAALDVVVAAAQRTDRQHDRIVPVRAAARPKGRRRLRSRSRNVFPPRAFGPAAGSASPSPACTRGCRSASARRSGRHARTL